MAGETFECPVCADDLSLDVRVLVGDGDDAMCRDCIIAQFEEDFERPDEEAETGFGVRWGLRRLRIGDFRELFDIDFIAKYEQRFLEFTTPREQRVYCPCLLQPIPGYDVRYCTAFVAAASDTEELVTCPQCDGTVCTLCQRPSDRDAHECTGAPEVTAGEEMDVSEMRRGKDYQRCPGCRKPYELREACNFVRCALSSYVWQDDERLTMPTLTDLPTDVRKASAICAEQRPRMNPTIGTMVCSRSGRNSYS